MPWYDRSLGEKLGKEWGAESTGLRQIIQRKMQCTACVISESHLRIYSRTIEKEL